MSLEQKINYQLNKVPGIKKIIKRIYQRTMYTISPKIKCEGNIIRISPDDANNEYFFGYYDKSPWDASNRYMLCMRAKDTWSDVSPKEKADILIIDTTVPENDRNRVKKIAETRSWNVQQGCMAQWLGPDFESHILYNDFRDGKYVSVIKEIETGAERVINAPVYTVSADGKTALTLDFSRLYNLRPGYGYYNLPERTKGEKLPDATAVWKIDIDTGEVSDLLTYVDFASFQPRPEMQEQGSVHKINHLMISPNGQRCMVLYRWFVGQRKYTRLVTFDVADGKNMYILSDDDMVSHCFWKNNSTILAFENKKKGGPGYYLMKDKTNNYIHCWPQLCNDGHPSYSPDGSLIVTDTYPNKARVAEIKLMDGKAEKKRDVVVIAKVFAPFKYDNDTRCDLHPRWSRVGDRVCFDSVFEGHRGLYTVDVSSIQREKFNNKNETIRIAFVFTSCKRSGPIQVMLDILKYLNKEIFTVYLITLYDEVDGESRLDDFISEGAKYEHCPIGKKDILLRRDGQLRHILDVIKPDVVHSLGVFPDYIISHICQDKQFITLHNYMHDDYPAKYGRVRGMLLEYLQMSAVKKARMVVTCSNSLTELYSERSSLCFETVQNGIDVYKYGRVNEIVKKKLRADLNIPEDKVVFIYTGQMIERKNHSLLLSAFQKMTDNEYLLLLGGGGLLDEFQKQYSTCRNVDFRGNVDNVSDYLRASDIYVSTSKSEGMPIGVLEAMATGLPVILSDIPQHKEVINGNHRIGYLFKQGDEKSLIKYMRNIICEDYKEMGENAHQHICEKFSAKMMSNRYQELYMDIVSGGKCRQVFGSD